MKPGGRVLGFLSHPNFLTVIRIAATPGIVILLISQEPGRLFTAAAALLFSLAAITDYLDGYFARRKGIITDFGKVMDPLADKLLVSSSLIMMTAKNWIPAWIVCVIIGREIAVTGLRNIISESGNDVSASNLGKYKTGCQIAAIIPLLIHYDYFGVNFHAVGYFFLICALIMTVWSGADYFFRHRALLKF